MTKELYNKIKILFFIVLAINASVFAQSDNKDLKNLHELQKEDIEAAFSNLKTPDKYKNESMVLMAEKLKLVQGKVKTNKSERVGYERYYVYSRTRIKLNDFNAIETYSDFEFQEGDEIEVKIVKQDGKTIEVDLKDAVDANNVSTSNKFVNLFLSDAKKKIAIKNLEIGDIIDCSSLNKYSNSFYRSTYYTNITSMPVVYLKNEFKIDKLNTIISLKTFNGAKTLEKKTMGKQILYSFEAEMIDKRKNELFALDSKTEPYYNLNIYFNALEFPYKNKPKNNEVFTKISENDLKDFVKTTLKRFNLKSVHYLAFINTEDVYNLSDEDYITKYYYLCREKAYLSDLAFNLKQETYGLGMLTRFMTHLEKRKIGYEVLLMNSNEKESIKEVINPDDFSWGLRFKLKGKYHYITMFNSSSQIDDISENFEGTEVYSISDAKNSKMKITTFILPTSTHADNVYSINIKSSFTNSLDSLKMYVSTEANGYQKNDNRYNLINNKEYFEEYYKLLENKKVITKNRKLYFFAESNYYSINRSFFNKEEERLNKQHYEALIKDKQENMEREAKNEYYVLKYDKYEPISDGRMEKNKKTAWKEEFTIGNTLLPAGNNFVFEIGKVIGRLSMVRNNEARYNRTKAFFIDFNKTFTVNMTIKIPDGKNAVGLENLNVNYSNTIGSLVSTAKVENGNIVWTLTKKLNNFRHEASEWKDYLSISDLGMQLNNAKIIFN